MDTITTIPQIAARALQELRQIQKATPQGVVDLIGRLCQLAPTTGIDETETVAKLRSSPIGRALAAPQGYFSEQANPKFSGRAFALDSTSKLTRDGLILFIEGCVQDRQPSECNPYNIAATLLTYCGYNRVLAEGGSCRLILSKEANQGVIRRLATIPYRQLRNLTGEERLVLSPFQRAGEPSYITGLPTLFKEVIRIVLAAKEGNAKEAIACGLIDYDKLLTLIENVRNISNEFAPQLKGHGIQTSPIDTLSAKVTL